MLRSSREFLQTHMAKRSNGESEEEQGRMAANCTYTQFDSHVHIIISCCRVPGLGSHDMARSLTQSFACDAHSWVAYGVVDVRAMPSGRREGEAVSMMSQLYGSDACMC